MRRLLPMAGVLLLAGAARGQPPPGAQPTSQPAASLPAASLPAASQPAASQPAATQPVKLPEWAPKLSATVKPAMVVLGDPVLVTITVRHRPGVSVNLPLQLELGKFSELAREESTREVYGEEGERGGGGPSAARKGGEASRGGGQVPEVERTFKLRVAAYELGELTLPAIEVPCLGPGGELLSLSTPAMPIRVTGLLRNEPNAKPKGLEPPISIFQRTYWLLYLLLLVAGTTLVVAATLVISRRVRERRRALRPPPPPVPAHVVALARLGRVDLEGMLERGELKELYLLLSEIMRDYLGRRWGFDALEMTSTEIGDELARRALPEELRARLTGFLGGCDLVKFAKYRPDAAAARESFILAEALVRETAEPAPAALPSAAAAPTAPAPPSEAAHD